MEVTIFNILSYCCLKSVSHVPTPKKEDLINKVLVKKYVVKGTSYSYEKTENSYKV